MAEPLEGLAQRNTDEWAARPRLPLLENRELDAVRRVRSRERGVLSGSLTPAAITR